MKSTLNPYLIFSGQCKEAMEFYKSILGGEVELSKYADMPGMPVSEDTKDKIIHALLKTEWFTLMGSDDNEQQRVTVGDNVHISISGTDDENLTEYFKKLSEDGSVQMPLEVAPWGDKFGMLTDKFGMHWMINVTKSSV